MPWQQLERPTCKEMGVTTYALYYVVALFAAPDLTVEGTKVVLAAASAVASTAASWTASAAATGVGWAWSKYRAAE